MIYLVIFSLPYIYIVSKNNLHMLQQNFYNENNRYLRWGFKNIKNSFNFLEIIIVLINLSNLFMKNKYLTIINIFYIVLFLINYQKRKKVVIKIPLKITSRIKRLMTTLTVLYLLPIIIFKDSFLTILILSIMIFFNFIMVYISNVINIPIEKSVFLYYKNKAVKKLRSFNNLEVIGITGSYGKTSSKNILNTILNVKYNALATPKNFNTQYGLIMTINNNLDKFNDYFIAEMGAFKKGRIKLLCDLVKPKYGILTIIGLAHLETFGSIENICEGKFELIEALPKDGLGILNRDDEKQVNYKLKNKCPIKWIGIDNKEADIYAKDIKIDENGMSFQIYFQELARTEPFKTKLLGKANIYNILASVALGYYLKMSIEELQLGVKLLKPVEHRLELKAYEDNVIIDDAYNSNPNGAKMALDVLKLMPGYKIVVTPGMIELGSMQKDANYEFGQNISKVADYVILVGSKQTKDIYDGIVRI